MTLTLNGCTIAGAESTANIHGISIGTGGTNNKLVANNVAFQNMHCALGLVDQHGNGAYLGTKAELSNVTFDEIVTYQYQLYYPAENSYFATYEATMTRCCGPWRTV